MCGLGVRATCLQRLTDVTKTSVQGHMLGVEFTCQIKQGGTLGEHYETMFKRKAQGVEDIT